MTVNFPTAIDTNTELLDAVDGVSAITAAHHNNVRDAVKALEAKVGVQSSAVPTSLDYRIGNPTGSHSHNGASGQGRPLNPTMLYPKDQGDGLIRRVLDAHLQGTAIVGSNVTAPVVMARGHYLEAITAAARRGPSGATLAFDINLNQPGPTSLWYASQGLRVIFAPGATAFRSAAYAVMPSIPSGAMLTFDVDTVGSSEPGQDFTFQFVFVD